MTDHDDEQIVAALCRRMARAGSDYEPDPDEQLHYVEFERDGRRLVAPVAVLRRRRKQAIPLFLQRKGQRQ